jgi:hypothetical protein
MVFAGKDWAIDCANPINYDSPDNTSKTAYFSKSPVYGTELCIKVRTNLYKIVKIPA